MIFSGGINPLGGRGQPRTPYRPPGRVISTCDFCLKDDVPCRVFEEGVWCDQCCSMAAAEEAADQRLPLPAIVAIVVGFALLLYALSQSPVS